jgi:hypothetical protein
MLRDDGEGRFVRMANRHGVSPDWPLHCRLFHIPRSSLIKAPALCRRRSGTLNATVEGNDS